ncbi:MAG: ATP-binding protein [Clostridia bacterium]|nr:ATP-binding protein [Clostridia bacterium]
MAFGKQEEKSVVSKSDRLLSELYKPATELTADKGLKIAIWGRAKVGKSYFCLTPPNGKIYAIDTESGLKVNIQSFDDKTKKRVFVAEILQFSGLKTGNNIDYNQILDVLDDAVNKILLAVKNGEEEDITIVIDSASDIWDWLGTWLGELPGVSHIGKDADKVNRLEWGKANKRYETIMTKLKMSGCNVICTYKAKDAISSSGSDLGFARPRWQKNSKHIFDVIATIELIGGKRIMKFTTDDCGSRYGDKIPDLENPSWEKLLKHLESHCGVSFG